MNVCHEDFLIVFAISSTFQAFEKGNLLSYTDPLVIVGDSSVNENLGETLTVGS